MYHTLTFDAQRRSTSTADLIYMHALWFLALLVHYHSIPKLSLQSIIVYFSLNNLLLQCFDAYTGIVIIIVIIIIVIIVIIIVIIVIIIIIIIIIKE